MNRLRLKAFHSTALKVVLVLVICTLVNLCARGERKGLVVESGNLLDKYKESGDKTPGKIEVSLHATRRMGNPRMEVLLQNKTEERLDIVIEKLTMRTSANPGMPRSLDSSVTNLESLDAGMEIRTLVPQSLVNDLEPGTYTFSVTAHCGPAKRSVDNLEKTFSVQSQLLTCQIGKGGALVLESKD